MGTIRSRNLNIKYVIKSSGREHNGDASHILKRENHVRMLGQKGKSPAHSITQFTLPSTPIKADKVRPSGTASPALTVAKLPQDWHPTKFTGKT